MGFVASAKKNAPFIGVVLAIAITTLALVVVVVALLWRIHVSW
jgi:hypothetical protein